MSWIIRKRYKGLFVNMEGQSRRAMSVKRHEEGPRTTSREMNEALVLLHHNHAGDVIFTDHVCHS